MRFYKICCIVVMVCTSMATLAQPYVAKKIRPNINAAGASLLLDNQNNCIHHYGAGICDLQESSFYNRLSLSGELLDTLDLCTHDIGSSTVFQSGDTILIGGHKSPYKLNFELKLQSASSGAILQDITLPIDSQYIRQLAHVVRKYDDKVYVAGRGKIEGLGMIPLLYVLDEEFKVDTLLYLDTVWNGRVKDIQFTEDSTLLLIYDMDEDGKSTEKKRIIGFDQELRRVYDYASEEVDRRSSTIFRYIGNGEMIFYAEKASDYDRPYLRRMTMDGEVVWEIKIDKRTFDYVYSFEGRGIQQLADSNLLIYGSWFDTRDKEQVFRDSPYFAKVDVRTGQRLWERMIADEHFSRDNAAAPGAIRDIVEMDNGDLALTGYISTARGSRMLFLRTSADGCITDDCPEVIDIRGTPVSDLKTVWPALAVQIYPNPVGGHYVQIDLEEPSQTNVMIYDLSGGLVLSAPLESGSNEISLEDLAAGVYVVQVALDHGRVYTQKLVRW